MIGQMSRDPQPIPKITAEDIERIVKRDYPPKHYQEIRSLLETLQTPEALRVKAAILKLGDGNLQKLKSMLKTATMDYRDVLAYAEYPYYFLNVQDQSGDDKKHNAIVKRDWQQYLEWLHKK